MDHKKEIELLPDEVFVNLPGILADGFLVSNYGRISNGESLIKVTVSGRYPMFSLRRNNTVKTYNVHRLVALAFIPKPDGAGSVVNHKDGNRYNNHYSNLEWCTQSENMKHAYSTGLRNPATHVGDKHPGAVLTDEIVLNLRADAASGKFKSKRQLCLSYVERTGVGYYGLFLALTGRRWTHLPAPVYVFAQ